jgi:hypothetical protein
MNPLKAHRTGLHPRLMTKHSPFRYFKPGPGLLHGLAQARGPGTKSLSTIGPLSMHPRPAFSVARAELELDGFAWAVVRGVTVGVTVPDLYS